MFLEKNSARRKANQSIWIVTICYEMKEKSKVHVSKDEYREKLMMVVMVAVIRGKTEDGNVSYHWDWL